MDYGAFTETIAPKVLKAVALINNPEIDPEVRQLNQEILLREVGQAVYAKIYDMNAFDFDIAHTTGPGLDDRYYGLAKVASYSVSTGTLGIEEYITNYIYNIIGKAQQDAFINADQSNKHPRVTRSESANACQWCRSKVGVYTNPPPEVFQRHGGCRGSIITEGFKSRNGLLKNYVKPQDR